MQHAANLRDERLYASHCKSSAVRGIESRRQSWPIVEHRQRMRIKGRGFNSNDNIRDLHEERLGRREQQYRKGTYGEKLAYYSGVPSMGEVRYQAMQDAN